ncbi:hypothetical protein [Methanocella paludicola]|uniref:hypothetical protein n=1 Tax=Methanocella paludicola TaxID=570267 RepID=UPI001E297F0C|nr:hypothetical protein [Methanocella paludicola]
MNEPTLTIGTMKAHRNPMNDCRYMAKKSLLKSCQVSHLFRETSDPISRRSAMYPFFIELSGSYVVTCVSFPPLYLSCIGMDLLFYERIVGFLLPLIYSIMNKSRDHKTRMEAVHACAMTARGCC